MASFAEVYRGAKRSERTPSGPPSSQGQPQPFPDTNGRLMNSSFGTPSSYYSNNNGNSSNINGNNNNKSQDKNSNKLAIHRPRLNRKTSPEHKVSSKLTTKFDPMKDRHMWAMWRTAVNGRIVDQVKRNEQIRFEGVTSENVSTVNGAGSESRSTYGKDLTSVPPLSRFVRLTESSQDIAQELMNEGHGRLHTTQFIYYGLPRVSIQSAGKSTFRHHTDNHHTNGYTDENTIFYSGPPNGMTNPDHQVYPQQPIGR